MLFLSFFFKGISFLKIRTINNFLAIYTELNNLNILHLLLHKTLKRKVHHRFPLLRLSGLSPPPHFPEVKSEGTSAQILGRKCVTVMVGETLLPFFVRPFLLRAMYIPG